MLNTATYPYCKNDKYETPRITSPAPPPLCIYDLVRRWSTSSTDVRTASPTACMFFRRQLKEIDGWAPTSGNFWRFQHRQAGPCSTRWFKWICIRARSRARRRYPQPLQHRSGPAPPKPLWYVCLKRSSITIIEPSKTNPRTTIYWSLQVVITANFYHSFRSQWQNIAVHARRRILYCTTMGSNIAHSWPSEGHSLENTESVF